MSFIFQIFLLPATKKTVIAETAQQAFAWGVEVKKNSWTKFARGGGHAWEFLFNFSKIMENAFITIEPLIFYTSS